MLTLSSGDVRDQIWEILGWVVGGAIFLYLVWVVLVGLKIFGETATRTLASNPLPALIIPPIVFVVVGFFSFMFGAGLGLAAMIGGGGALVGLIWALLAYD